MAVMQAASPYKRISTASNNATLVQTGRAWLYGLSVNNTNAAVRYLKFYDKATAPNPASDVPVLTIPLAASSTVHLPFDAPVAFRNGLGFALVTGISDSDNTAVGASEHVVNLYTR